MVDYSASTCAAKLVNGNNLFEMKKMLVAFGLSILLFAQVAVAQTDSTANRPISDPQPQIIQGEFLGSVGDLSYDCSDNPARSCLVVYHQRNGRIQVNAVTETGEKPLLTASKLHTAPATKGLVATTRFSFDDVTPAPSSCPVAQCGGRAPAEPNDGPQVIRCGNDDNAVCYYLNTPGTCERQQFDVIGGTGSDGRVMFMAETVTQQGAAAAGGSIYRFTGVTRVQYQP